MMKRYEFVQVHVNGCDASDTSGHRHLILVYAAKGYKYAGFVPTNISENGKIEDIDLIFEKDV